MNELIQQILYNIIMIIAKIHDFIMNINNSFEKPFTDSELHFFVMGTIGLFMVLIVHPLFKYLSRKNIMVITWLFVITFMLMLIFAIEVGQQLTNTGTLDIEDILYGIFGFIVFFAVFEIVRISYKYIRKKLKKRHTLG